MSRAGRAARGLALGVGLALAPPCVLAAEPPRLVLLLVVDQMRPEQLDPALPGGLGRLRREGRWFADAALAHAGTETCAGHAAIATGRHPGAAGVPGNQFLVAGSGLVRGCEHDPEPAARSLGGSEGRSPRFLRASGLGDWLRSARRGSRIFALSAKARAAIPLGGRRPDGVFWLDREEALGFTTSRYYREELPGWLGRFNGGAAADGGFLAGLPPRWEHASGAAANGARRDDHPAESDRFGRTSGHPVRVADRGDTLQRLYVSPFLDRVTLTLATRLVHEEGLGRDEVPDLLALSLSATDLVGHSYGPESQEALDARLRLDAWLGEFLAELEGVTRAARLLVVLTSDHGVLPLPEWLEETGQGECPVRGGRVDARALGTALARDLAARFGAPGADASGWVQRAGFRLAVNRGLAAARGVDAAAVAEAARVFLETQPGIARVWTAQEMRAGRGPAPFAVLYRNSFDPERSGDLAVQPQRGCLLARFPSGTSHGSPYRYDRAVPLLFWGAGVEPGIVRGRAGPVDVAPTLAAVLGVPAPADLDGEVLDLGGGS